jgi:hypothetical protein
MGRHEPPPWEIEFLPEADRWHKDLAPDPAARITAGLDRLREVGPTQGRKLVDSIKGSRHHNMKELRTGTMRVLFIFDPDQRAVMLVGGDKSGNWKGWYKENIKHADRLYDQYLERTGKGGTSQSPSSRRAGRRSEGRDR